MDISVVDIISRKKLPVKVDYGKKTPNPGAWFIPGRSHLHGGQAFQKVVRALFGALQEMGIRKAVRVERAW
jgi:hypothetical protein